MVRVTGAEFLQDGSKKKYMEFAGLSTDEKPIEDHYATGSVFLEVDTQDVYFYDEASAAWIKVGE